MNPYVVNARRLKEFIRTLPEVKVGRTNHYDSRENSVYLRPENKKLEDALWHELAHAYLHQNFRWERFLIFSTGFFIIFTASGILFFGFLTLFSRSIWIIDVIFTAVCLTLMLVEEKVVTYYGKLLKREARQEILSKIRKAPSLRL
ncbi:MAG: hypothetical protein ACE5HG_01385 [Candidatus Bathyarchaeia archaeon]